LRKNPDVGRRAKDLVTKWKDYVNVAVTNDDKKPVNSSKNKDERIVISRNQTDYGSSDSYNGSKRDRHSLIHNKPSEPPLPALPPEIPKPPPPPDSSGNNETVPMDMDISPDSDNNSNHNSVESGSEPRYLEDQINGSEKHSSRENRDTSSDINSLDQRLKG
jgi:hypothetical protein